MKKLVLMLIVAFSLSSCASHRCHGVGNTPQAYKAKKQSQQRIKSQFHF